MRELATKYVGIDPVYEPIPVRPVVHYMMGGVSTDINARTIFDGLYAAGETACVSINGANRLGSNSLTELLVFGKRAGRNAAEYAGTQAVPPSAPLEALAADEQRRLDQQFLKKVGGKERIATIRQQMHKAMDEGAGIYRDEEKMQNTCNELRSLRQRFKDIIIRRRGSTFNTERPVPRARLMLDVAETVANSALRRKEVAGLTHPPRFPKRDDENFCDTLWLIEPPMAEIEYSPVKITRWQPEERKY